MSHQSRKRISDGVILPSLK